MNRIEPTIETILEQAVEIADDAQRQAFVNAACADNDARRSQLERLIANHFRAGSFLEHPAAVLETAFEPAESVGTQIGPYKLLEQIGEGGMGLVFMAEQSQPLRRLVALKVLKPGMDTREVVARFEAERQALALMDHPNIAKIFDAGRTRQGDKETGRQGDEYKSGVSSDAASLSPCLPVSLSDPGRPYFVMELVKGPPITEFCDQHRMTTRQRLELFVTVCHAVQHAHQKGVIHRDLKPGNVLVTLHDTVAVPKVIDFGIAKATGQRLTEQTLFTHFSQMLGSPLYMSPEQAQMNGLDVDTRSDIYSLGVMLYELLTGTTPFVKETLKEAGLDEMRRLIREEEPPRPSDRVSTLGAEACSTVHAQRGVDNRRLSDLLRGELDWIVMKSLEKDRNRRYESASALAADVQRYLNDEPVEACPPSASYRLRKFMRRHKTALVMVTILGMGLLSAAAIASMSFIHTSSALTREAAANERLESALYYQTINLAERARSAGQVRLAEQLLLDCKPSLRGWEWHYLRRLRYGSVRAVSHSSHLFSMAISRAGRFIAVGGSDGTVAVLDSQGLGLVHVLQAHVSWARAVAFSPDGERLVSGGWDRRVRLWDVKTRTKVWEGQAESIVQCVAFHPEGRLIASSGASGHIQFWNAHTGAATTAIANHDDNLFALAFSPDGQFLAAGGSDKRVKIWRTEDGGLVHHLPAQAEQILGLAFSPDGRLLAAASGGFYTNEQRGELCVWETNSGRLRHRLGGPDGSTFCVTFSPDGTRVATGGSADPTVKVWDVATGLQAISLRGHTEAIWSVAFSPDGNRLFSASGDHTVRVWDATPTASGPQPGMERSVLAGFDAEVHGLAFHPDSKLLVTACPEGDLQVWDALTRQRVQSIKAKGTCCVAFSRDGKWLAAGSFGVIRIWEVPSWKPRFEFPTGDVVRALSFHPAGDQLAAATGKFVGIWDLATGVQQTALRAHTNFLLSALYHPAGQVVASAGFEGEVKVWNVGIRPPDVPLGGLVFPSSPLFALGPAWVMATGMPPRNLPGHVGRVSCIAFSPDGRDLVSAGVDGVFHRWDTATWNRITPPGKDRHGGHVRALAYSPDGAQLASAGSDATVRVWNANDFRPMFALRGHTDAIGGIAYSPDGKLIASVSLDRTVRIWDANPPADSPAVTAVDPGK